MKIKEVKQEGELVTLLLEGQVSFVRIVFDVGQPPNSKDYPNIAHLLQDILNHAQVVEMIEF